MIDVLCDAGVRMLADEENIIKSIEKSCFVAKNIRKPILCLRFAPNDAVQQLNAEWRDKDKVTDVLSFPMQEADDICEQEELGDIIIAVPFVMEEANRLALSPEQHVLHLIIHGTLHLLGYDHIQDKDAQMMQPLEQKIMQQLGLHNPYPELASVGLP